MYWTCAWQVQSSTSLDSVSHLGQIRSMKGSVLSVEVTTSEFMVKISISLFGSCSLPFVLLVSSSIGYKVEFANLFLSRCHYRCRYNRRACSNASLSMLQHCADGSDISCGGTRCLE